MNKNKQWGRADIAVAALCLLLLFWFLSRAQSGVSYNWDWSAVGGYLFSEGEGGYRAGLLTEGLLTSLRLLFWGGVIGVAAGLTAALAALSPVAGLRWLALLYVESLRNLPPIVFMFIFYFFVSAHILGGSALVEYLSDSDNVVLRILIGDPRRAENFISGALCLGVFEGAFFAEVFRAGIAAVPRGQWDGARSVGLGRLWTLRFVILPQAMRNVAAPAAGQMVLLIKDSAILSVISVEELTFSAQETAVSTQQVFEVWITASLFYFALCWPLLAAAKRLEIKN